MKVSHVVLTPIGFIWIEKKSSFSSRLQLVSATTKMTDQDTIRKPISQILPLGGTITKHWSVHLFDIVSFRLLYVP